jgi:hypothetical protein
VGKIGHVSTLPGFSFFDAVTEVVCRPASIVTVSHGLIQCRFDFKQQQMWVGIAHGLLDLYTRKAEAGRRFLCDICRPYKTLTWFRRNTIRICNVQKNELQHSHFARLHVWYR